MAPSHTDHSVQHVGDPSYSSQLTCALNDSRNQAAFCDVTIIVEDQRFPAHRVVLSSASEYFQGMFSSGFQESTMSEVTIPGMAESFAQILDFMYTGYFTLSLQTVVGVLEMACYMVLTEAVKLCAEYLKSNQDKLTHEDYLGIWSFANDHSNLADIAQMCQMHVVQNFLKCVQSQVFLDNLPSKLLMDILDDEAIETDTITEEMILEGSITWMKRDWEQRKIHVVDLLKKIRLGLVPVDRLRQILGDRDELLSIPECKEMVEEVAKLSVTKNSAVPPLNESHPDLFATRNTVSGNISVGDLSKAEGNLPLVCRNESGCYQLTKVADIRNKLPHVIAAKAASGCQVEVSNTGHMYAALCFQSDSDETERASARHNFFMYDSDKNEWCVMPPMHKTYKCPYFPPELYEIDDYIYAMAPVDSKFVVEKYSIRSKMWEIVVDQDIEVGEFHTIGVSDSDILIVSDTWVEGPNRAEDDLGEHGEGGLTQINPLLFKTSTNELVGVSIDTDLNFESTLKLNLGSTLVWNEDRWHYLDKDNHEELGKAYECTCDFKSDKSSIVVGKPVGEELNSKVAEELKGIVDRVTEADYNYTFDKRKLGMVRVPCECPSHV